MHLRFPWKVGLRSRRALRQAAIAGLALPTPVLRGFAGAEQRSSDGSVLDLQTQCVLRVVNGSGLPRLNKLNVRTARRFLDFLAPFLDVDVPSTVQWLDRSIPCEWGQLPIRLYTPAGVTTPSPALVFFHGGGLSLGSLDTHHGLCGYLAERARCRVVSVDYRLAPEHPFPAAVEDALDSFRWVAREAESLGVCASQIAVGGDSGGGNLAAVVCQLARKDSPRPAFQLLFYPALDLTRSSESHREFAKGYLLSNKIIEWFLCQYFAEPGLERDPRASPLLAEDLSGLPSALVLTAGFDPLRDEGKAYVERLQGVGVVATCYCGTGLIHGFASMGGGLSAARQAVDRAAEILAEGFAAVPT